MIRVLTHGTFDIPHIGHAIFLYKASQLGDYLTIGLSTDEYALTQGKKTIFPYEERFELLKQLPFVDKIYPNDQAGMKEAIIHYEADIVAIGSDWGERYCKQISCSPEWLTEQGVALVYLPYTKKISTTIIKGKCNQLG